MTFSRVDRRREDRNTSSTPLIDWTPRSLDLPSRNNATQGIIKKRVPKSYAKIPNSCRSVSRQPLPQSAKHSFSKTSLRTSFGTTKMVSRPFSVGDRVNESEYTKATTGVWGYIVLVTFWWRVTRFWVYPLVPPIKPALKVQVKLFCQSQILTEVKFVSATERNLNSACTKPEQLTQAILTTL